ncbi:MAG: hypothetical protein QW493_04835, partial [Candidatus Bathyarchaeia archaeon]
RSVIGCSSRLSSHRLLNFSDNLDSSEKGLRFTEILYVVNMLETSMYIRRNIRAVETFLSFNLPVERNACPFRRSRQKLVS